MPSELKQLQQELQDIDAAKVCSECGHKGQLAGRSPSRPVTRVRCTNPKCKRHTFCTNLPIGTSVLYRAIQFRIFQICRDQGATLAVAAEMALIKHNSANQWSWLLKHKRFDKLPVSIAKARALIANPSARHSDAPKYPRPQAGAKPWVPSTPAIDLLQEELKRLPKVDRRCHHCGNGKVKPFSHLRYRTNCPHCGKEIMTDQPVGYMAYERGIKAKIVKLYLHEGAMLNYGLQQANLKPSAWRRYNSGGAIPLTELRKAFRDAKATLAAALAARQEQMEPRLDLPLDEEDDADAPLDLLPDEPEKASVTWDVFTTEHRGHQVSIARREDVMVRWVNPNRAVWIADGQCQGVTQQAIRIAKSIAHGLPD